MTRTISAFTIGVLAVALVGCGGKGSSTTGATPTPTPITTPTPVGTPTPNPSPTPVGTPSPTPTPKPSPTPNPSPTPTPNPSPTPTPNPSPTPTPNPTPSPTPTPTPGFSATAVSPAYVYVDVQQQAGVNVSLFGTDFAVGDHCDIKIGSLTPSIINPTIVGTTQLNCPMGIDLQHLLQEWGSIRDCRDITTGPCTNALTFGSAGNGKNQLVASSTGLFYSLVTSSGQFNINDDTVRRHNSDGSVAGSFGIGSGAMKITLDEATGMLPIYFCTAVNACSIGFWGADFDTNPGHAGATSISGSISDLASSNGRTCAAQPIEGVISCASVVSGATSGFVSTASGAAGSRPAAVAKVTFGSGSSAVHDVVSFASGNGKLQKFSDTTMAADGPSLTLAGLGTVDHFQMSVIESGGASGTAVLLDEERGIEVDVNLSTMTETKRVTHSRNAAQATLALTTDPVHGAGVVGLTSISAHSTSLVRTPVLPGSPAPFGSTGTFPAGLAYNPSNNMFGVMASGVITLVPNQ